MITKVDSIVHSKTRNAASLICAFGLGASALAFGTLAATAQEVVLRAAAGLPTNNVFTQRFIEFAETVNERGKGLVRIEYVGGPEAIPPQQQDQAIRTGVIDMLASPASYYIGSVPEAHALKGSNRTPAELRENGTYDLLDEIWREKLNATYIAWLAAGVPYYIYTIPEPKFNDAGEFDLSGVKMRTVPTYNDWFARLGASNVTLQAAEIFPGLERRVVDGLGWPAIGVTDLGVQEFVKYRVGPGVWQVDVSIIAGTRKWDQLSDEAKEIIRTAAVELEQENQERYAQRVAEEEAILTDAGVELYQIEGERAKLYLDIAFDTVWNEVKEASPDRYDTLREHLYEGE